MTSRGRPSTGVPVHIRIPADVLAALDEMAAAIETTRAAMIRAILLDWFDDQRNLESEPANPSLTAET